MNETVTERPWQREGGRERERGWQRDVGRETLAERRWQRDVDRETLAERRWQGDGCRETVAMTVAETVATWRNYGGRSREAVVERP